MRHGRWGSPTPSRLVQAWGHLLLCRRLRRPWSDHSSGKTRIKPLGQQRASHLQGASLISLLLSLILALSGCLRANDGLLVFAAASLTDLLEPLGAGFSQAQGVPVRFSYGGSTTLAQQLVRGAPADLFIAAGSAPMDTLAARNLLLDGTRRGLLTNALVLVGRRGLMGTLQPRDLLSPAVRKVAIADPRLAPAGQYARAALERLGLWEALEPKLLLGLDVRTALAYVERGDADVAVVYRTDAARRKGLTILLTFPSDSYPEIRYPIAVLRGSQRREAATAFIAFLQTEDARAIFQTHGWGVPAVADPSPLLSP